MNHPCQAVIVRFAPDHSGEMLNIGVVLLSPGQAYMVARFLDGWRRITQAFPGADGIHLRACRVQSSVLVQRSGQRRWGAGR